MAECKNTQLPGSGNPLQNAAQPNDHGASGVSARDNVIYSIPCDASVAVGNVVRMNSGTAFNALASSLNTARAIGICIAKSGSTSCDVQVTGYTAALFSGLSDSSDYFLSDSTPGALTTTPPTASGSVVLALGRPYTSTQFTINIGIPLIRA